MASKFKKNDTDYIMKNATRVMQLNIQIPQTMLFLMVNDTHDSKSGGGGGVQGSASGLSTDNSLSSEGGYINPKIVE